MSFLLSASRRSRNSRLEMPPRLRRARGELRFSSSISRCSALGLAGLEPRSFVDLAAGVAAARVSSVAPRACARALELARAPSRARRWSTPGRRSAQAARLGRRRDGARPRRRRRRGAPQRPRRAPVADRRASGDRAGRGTAPGGLGPREPPERRVGEGVDVGVDRLASRGCVPAEHRRRGGRVAICVPSSSTR